LFGAIVFDLDGTLIASHDLIASTVNSVLVSRGHPVVDAGAVHALTGLPLEEIFRAVLPAAEHESALRCVDEYRRIFDRDVLPALEPIPGTRQMLATVVPLAPLAVATGRLTSTARLMLARSGLDGYFGVVLGADAVIRPKPYPDLLLEVLFRLGRIAPASVLVVGDSAADVAMARAAGARVCAVTWGAQTREALLETGPDWCVDCWEQLTALLG